MAGETTSYTLGDLVDLSQGLAINAKTSHLISDFGTPLLRITDLINGTRCQFVDVAKVPQQCVVTPEEIIYTRTGQVGLVFKGKRGVAHNNCFKVAPKSELLDSEYLYWFLFQESVREHANAIASGSVQKDLNHTAFKSIPIELPCLQTQRAVTPILNSIADKIELNRRMNATLAAVARALFQSWFVDFDPVRAKLDGRKPLGLDETTAALFPDSFQESSLGHTPKGWEVRSLDKTAHYLNGLALQKYPPGDGLTLPVIKIAQLRKGDSVGADRCNTELPVNYIVQDGDVLFSWSGSLVVELWCGGPGALNQHLFKVTSPEFPKWFYYLWTLCHLDEFRLIAAGKATTMGHIQRGHLTAAKVLIPPRPLLDAMTRTMSPLIDQLIANRIQARTLATLRDTLLPKLLSGELQVADVASKTATHL